MMMSSGAAFFKPYLISLCSTAPLQTLTMEPLNPLQSYLYSPLWLPDNKFAAIAPNLTQSYLSQQRWGRNRQGWTLAILKEVWANILGKYFGLRTLIIVFYIRVLLWLLQDQYFNRIAGALLLPRSYQHIDGSVNNINCITQHEDCNTMTNQAVLSQVTPLLRNKDGRKYYHHSPRTSKKHITNLR